MKTMARTLAQGGVYSEGWASVMGAMEASNGLCHPRDLGLKIN